jgi:hypothetical protein
MPGGPTPEHPIVLPPEGGGELPGDVFPSHPIVLPPGFSGDHPANPIVIPPPPLPGHPAHPIVIPPDLGIWGPTDPRPTNPIVIPPPTPVYPPEPTHPIVLPPDGSGPGEPDRKWEVKTYWTEESGWGIALVPTEEHPGVPTPSRRTP